MQVAGFESLDYDTVASARVIEVLQWGSLKDIELVQADGEIFVRRTYISGGVSEIEKSGLSFSQAWGSFNEMLAAANVQILPSVLLSGKGSGEPIIATEYVDNVGQKGVETLPQAKKVELARNLGSLLTSHPKVLPAMEGFAVDALINHGGQAVIIDIDPYLHLRRMGLPSHTEKPIREGRMGAFMRQIASNIELWATSDEERTAMAIGFVRTAGRVLVDDSSPDLMWEFGHAHFMANGMSYQQTI